jgi:colicin import membrane protein
MRIDVDQQELELQLKVWKELAISKQVLLRTVTDALKLDPACSQDQLKEAIDAFLKKIAKADTEVVAAQNGAKSAIAEMERKLVGIEKAKTVAENTAAQLQTANEKLTREMAAERTGLATEMAKLKERVVEKEKQLKAVNTALADTPENVLKKMNTFKKQKQEESEARQKVEASFQTLRREKQEQDQKTTKVQESSAKLVATYRSLHELSAKLHEQLKPLVKDENDLPKLPDLDKDLVEAIENPDAKPEKNGNGKKK